MFFIIIENGLVWCVTVAKHQTMSVSCATGVVKRIIPAVASTNAVIAGKKPKCF